MYESITTALPPLILVCYDGGHNAGHDGAAARAEVRARSLRIAVQAVLVTQTAWSVLATGFLGSFRALSSLECRESFPHSYYYY